MIDFTLETHLDRSPTEVFDYITDPTRLPDVADQHGLVRARG